MILSARPLIDVASVNIYRPAPVWQFTENDPVSLYFQLVDTALDTETEGFTPAGRRYIPATGATMSVTLDSIDMIKSLTRSATNPYSDDRSIWLLQLLATDLVRGSIGMTLTLTEGSDIKRGRVQTIALVNSRYLTK